MALQFSITAIGTILVQAALNLLGSTVVASYSVSCKVEQLVTQPFAAMGVTMATYCAQNRGINDLNRIRKGVKAANIMSGAYAVLVYGLVYIALPYIVPLFISEQVEMVCGYARTYITICGMFFIPLGMIFIFRNALQGCGFGFMPMMGGVVELLSRGIVAFAAAHLMSYVGVCFANASAWLTAGIFLWIAYHFLMKKMVRDKRVMRNGCWQKQCSNAVKRLRAGSFQKQSCQEPPGSIVQPDDPVDVETAFTVIPGAETMLPQ